MGEPVREVGGFVVRTAADLASVLLELGRALRAWRFAEASRPPHGPGVTRPTIDRLLLAWQAETLRAGAIEIRMDELGFHATDVAERVASEEPLEELAGALRALAIERLRITPEINGEALACLLELLASARPDASAGAAACAPLPGEAQERIAAHKGIDVGTASPEPVAPPGPVAAPDLPAPEMPLGLPAAPRAGREATAHETPPTEGGASPSPSELGTWVEQALSRDADDAVRAARELLRHGEPAARALLDRLEVEPDRDRAAQLGAVVIALGEHATSSLEQAMAGPSPVRARVGVRLAGELQSPRLVPGLRASLLRGSPRLRRDAARALATVANDDAVRALVEGLQSPVEEVAVAAAGCLGALHRPATLRPLLDVLERATEQRQIAVAREVIRALAHFPPRAADSENHPDDPAPQSGVAARADHVHSQIVPKLVAILERRRLLGRGPLHELKLAALAALERMPGPEARRALRHAANARDAQIRERARHALERLAASSA